MPARNRSLVLFTMAGIRGNDPERKKGRPVYELATATIDGRSLRHVVIVVDDARAGEHADVSLKFAKNLQSDLTGPSTRRRVDIVRVPRRAGFPVDPHDFGSVEAHFAREKLLRTTQRGTHSQPIFDELRPRRHAIELVVSTSSGTPAQWGALAALAEQEGFCVSLVQRTNDGWRLLPVAREHREDDLDSLRACPERLARAYGTMRGGVVLLTGATGTGKSEWAERLHKTWRPGKAFVKRNCAAIPENLLESELFGHARGAFTGATERRVGAFQAAHEGTLFLDEIGELPPTLQAKLLMVLDSARVGTRDHTIHVLPVGTTTEVRVDVRVVLATNRDLPTAVREGRFRDDLYARISTHEVVLPPLRERPHRIVFAYLQRLWDATKRHGRSLVMPKDGLRALLDLAYDPAASWSWNYRDVSQSAERLAFEAVYEEALRSAAQHPTGDTTPELLIGPELVQREARRLQAAWRQRARLSSPKGAAVDDLAAALEPGAFESLSELERVEAGYLLQAWRASEGVKAQAWRWLVAARIVAGASPRTDPGKLFEKRWASYRWRKGLVGWRPSNRTAAPFMRTVCDSV
jgi:DNA-binding NtrC family response regulator